ncbi:hypothetical protein [Aeromicrobium sp. Sec7.5]|uniref:hypothetical protein n=1 Tax=Aeromicrobium sp. Sec7.5 TaxID=3121276 RepID=UPI002FE4880F
MHLELQFWKTWLISHLTGEKVRHDERGIATEYLIIAAVMGAAALTVCAILVAKWISSANSVPIG